MSLQVELQQVGRCKRLTSASNAQRVCYSRKQIVGAPPLEKVEPAKLKGDMMASITAVSPPSAHCKRAWL